MISNRWLAQKRRRFVERPKRRSRSFDKQLKASRENSQVLPEKPGLMPRPRQKPGRQKEKLTFEKTRRRLFLLPLALDLLSVLWSGNSRWIPMLRSEFKLPASPRATRFGIGSQHLFRISNSGCG